MLENGIKPTWVFDGKPPTLKSGEVLLNFKKYQNFCGYSYLQKLEILNFKLNLLFFYGKLARRKKLKEEAKDKAEEA